MQKSKMDIEPPEQVTTTNTENKPANNNVSYMLFALGAILIVVGIYLCTYSAAEMQTMTVLGYQVNIPTGRMIQPYLPEGVIAMLLAVVLIGVALFNARKAV